MDPVKDLFSEMSNDNRKNIVGMIKDIPVDKRLDFLRRSEPADSVLLNLHNSAKETEDYEVCNVTKILLEERGTKF